MLNRESENNETIEKRINRLWGWILHEDNLFMSRGSFFLVAESMFFAAFATLAVNQSVQLIFVFIFGIVGVLCSLVWIYLAWVHIHLTMNPLKAKLRELIPDYAGITKSRGKYPSSHLILGVFFPISLLIAWLSLLMTLLIFGV